MVVLLKQSKIVLIHKQVLGQYSEVHTIITDSLKNKGGIAVDYLEARTYPGPIMNAMLVYMGEEQAGGEDAAIEFLSQHEDLWTSWVSADAAAKIKAGL